MTRLSHGLLVAGFVATLFAVVCWQRQRQSAADRRRLDELVRRLTAEPRPELWAEWRDLHRRHPEWVGK